MRRLLCLLAILFFMSGCVNFQELRNELNESKSQLGRIAGSVTSPSCVDCPTILVAVESPSDKTVHTYRVLERPGAFEMVTSGSSNYLFGFNDLNNDFQFQPGEPAAWLELPKEFSAGTQTRNIQILLTTQEIQPPSFGSLLEMRGKTLGEIDVELGFVTSLSDTRFSPEFAEQGIWKPLSFMKNGHAGIYFLYPYDSKKIPVLFVHGINGTPRDFSSLAMGLDKNKFQPWFLYYPSGIDLSSLGDGMLGMLSELRHRYPFKQLHLVAHSMGGLVSRSYLLACTKNNACNYLRSFTSIASPFAGHDAAKSGVDYAPVVVPAWRNLVPGSSFLNELFTRELPHDIPHHLIFGYRNTALLGKTSSDGTITLTSQLRMDAQRQAHSVRGYDEDHNSILQSNEVIDYVSSLLTQSTSK